jgi:uncharacterized protein
MAQTTRRNWTATAMAALGVKLAGQDGQRPPITSASLPADPVAPRVQDGTLPEQLPFGPAIEFVRRDAAPRVQPFAMSAVRLLPCVFLDAQHANRAFVLEQSPERLLHVFRINAGIASSAAPLGGWEKPDCELRGHFVGHYLSACALFYAGTGDTEFKTRCEYLVAELAKCQQKLQAGYLSAFPIEFFGRLTAREKVWAPFYTLHKIMAGLLDMHTHCGTRQALVVLVAMADWADQYSAALTEERMQMVLDTEYGGMNEVLYSLAAVTGEERFARVGDRFTKKRFFNPLALRRDELRGLHTNTHIPQVIGAARRYEISSDQRFRDVADYFWQTVIETRTYATGGTSNNEGWLVQPNRLAAELSMGHDTNECCCVYNMLKLTRQRYQWTADPRLFDYYERALYNHRLGTINPAGETQYYLGVAPGSWRTFATKHDSFWCCTGTGIEEHAKLNDSIYFHDEQSLYVNLFIPSEVNWQAKQFRLRQETKFPEEAQTSFTVTSSGPVKLTLQIRVPFWVAGAATVKINGKPSDVSAAGGSYLSITRTWNSGDRLEMQLPMALRFEPMPDDPNLRAVLYGPLLLASEVGGAQPDPVSGAMGPDLKKYPAAAIPVIQAASQDVSEWLRPGADSLTFHTTGHHTGMTFKPFYRMTNERYAIYWRMT